MKLKDSAQVSGAEKQSLVFAIGQGIIKWKTWAARQYISELALN